MWDIIQAAGWPIWPLILTSLVSVALIIERGWALRRSAVIDHSLFEQIAAQAQRPPSRELLQQLDEHSALGTVLAGGLACKLRDRDHLMDSLEVAGRRAAADLERFLPILSMLASMAPLLGLLGTVIGMIEIFGSTTATGADTTALAHGIAIALYNTAFGLMVAIPAAVAHRIYRVRVDQYVQQLEDYGRKLLDLLVAQPLAEQMVSAPPRAMGVAAESAASHRQAHLASTAGRAAAGQPGVPLRPNQGGPAR